MTNFNNLKGKLIKLNNSYPVRDEADTLLGFTEVGTLAVITDDDTTEPHGYYEITIVTGKFAGIDYLCLNNMDIKLATFIFNKSEHTDSEYMIHDEMYIKNIEIA